MSDPQYEVQIVWEPRTLSATWIPFQKNFEDFGPKEMKDVDSEMGLRDNPSHWTVC